MQNDSTPGYDVVIIGGGLAGLTLSIQLAKKGFSVLLFEKEEYPFHKVCGEYISMESWNFLESLGVPLTTWELPRINQLVVSSNSGRSIKQPLPLGGFGISRYKLDYELAQLAREAGVNIRENTKVNDVIFINDRFTVHYDGGVVNSRIVCGTFGKKSNLDVKWKRSFLQRKKNRLNNFIGIKYHITGNYPDDTIELHNFQNGYAGLVKIEEDQFCLCYLTTASLLQQHHNSISEMEKNALSKNPLLKNIFETALHTYEGPLSISQISFDRKEQVVNHVLFIGDAAGMITPLCGNGMSMAMHGSKIASASVVQFLQGTIDRMTLENSWKNNWNAEFAVRLKTGRMIQRIFGHPLLTRLFIGIIKPFPSLINMLIRKTHGKPF